MKALITILALSSSLLFAETINSDTSIKNFSGTYNEPRGEGQADEFQGINGLTTKIKVELEKIDDQSVLVKYDNEEVLYENLPSSLFEMKELQWNNFNFYQIRGSVKLSVSQMKGRDSKSTSSLSNLEVTCFIFNRNFQTTYEKLLENCTRQGSIKLDSYTNNNPQANGLLSSFLHRALNGPLVDISEVTNLDFNIMNQKFTLSGKVKAGLSAKIKANGGIWYIKNEKELKIELKSVKAGIISIKNQVFQELESSNDPNLRVERPFIYYKINIP